MAQSGPDERTRLNQRVLGSIRLPEEKASAPASNPARSNPAVSNAGPIDNACLVESAADAGGGFRLRKGLKPKRHFRNVNEQTWRYLSSTYGGGPTIFREAPGVPPRVVVALP